MENGFTPRIVVPNDDDASTVAAALTGYLHGIFARVQLTGDIVGAIEEGKRSIELLEILVDSAKDEHAKRVFGTIPDDVELSETLDRMRKEMGE